MATERALALRNRGAAKAAAGSYRSADTVRSRSFNRSVIGGSADRHVDDRTDDAPGRRLDEDRVNHGRPGRLVNAMRRGHGEIDDMREFVFAFRVKLPYEFFPGGKRHFAFTLRRFFLYHYIGSDKAHPVRNTPQKRCFAHVVAGGYNCGTSFKICFKLSTPLPRRERKKSDPR